MHQLGQEQNVQDKSIKIGEWAYGREQMAVVIVGHGFFLYSAA
jgi:hypothetical protein